MLKIYGADLSSPSNKVRFAANHLGLDYEYVRVSIKEGENKTERFLVLHPAGKIPVIEDDGFVMFESDAIIKYLCAKTDSPLYPGGLRARALTDQWADFATIHVGGAVGKVLFNRVFAPLIGVPVDQRSLQEGLEFFNRFCAVVDKQLQKQQFLAGESLSVADFSLLAALDPVETAEISMDPFPATGRWMERLRRQEFYQKCHRRYGERLRSIMARRKG